MKRTRAQCRPFSLPSLRHAEPSCGGEDQTISVCRPFSLASTAVHAPEGKDSEVTALKRSASFLLIVWRFLRRKSRFKVRVHENKRRRGDPIPRAYVLDKQSDPQSNEIDGCRGFDTASGHPSVPTFVVCGHRLVTLSSKTDRAENWEAPY